MFRKLINKIYDASFNSRCDNPGYKYYFTYKDFDNVKETPIEFKTKDDLTLRGGLYYNLESIDQYDHVVVFLHGIGGGYLAYMTEIIELVKRGFLVLSYDYAATMSSDGDKIGGFSRPLIDIQYCYKYIKESDLLKNKKISLVGHSWGGYTAMNSISMFNDLTHVVAISAPLSYDMIMKQTSPLAYPFAHKAFLKYEEKIFGDVVYLSGLNIIDKPTKMLYIYSTDDDIVYYKYHYEPLIKKDYNPLHEFIKYDNRLHFPTYSDSGITELYKLKRRFSNYLKEKKTTEEIQELLKDVDYRKVVDQDQDLWNKIAIFLNK